ncbi:transposase [Streptomyces sp. NPDC004031]
MRSPRTPLTITRPPGQWTDLGFARGRRRDPETGCRIAAIEVRVHARSRLAGRGDLTHEQWPAPEPLLPKGTRAGQPPAWPRRQLTDGIRSRVRTRVPCRDVPGKYAPWNRVYDLYLFRRWQQILTGSSPWPTRKARSSGT